MSSYDTSIYAHAIDQTNSSGIPYRYASAGSIGTCPSTDIEDSATLLGRAKGLYGNNYEKKITNQVECKPNTFNAGNWYHYPTATAGSKDVSDAPNSICPKGWQLPPNSGSKSYYNLIRTAYGITTSSSDSGIISSPLSFIRSGMYYPDTGTLGNRGNNGGYWSSTSAYALGLKSNKLNPQQSTQKYFAHPIRCVSR